MANEHKLPTLDYGYDALEPSISAEIMEIHHTKHHQTYVNNLNNAEKAYAAAVQSNDVRKQIELQSALKFNGGGHINHSLFWKNLAPVSAGGGQLQEGPLKQAIERDFGSLDNLKQQFNATIATIQGSGWGWVGFNPKSQKLEILTTKDQDPLITHNVIIGVDAWEHAYYLQYKNNKVQYFTNIWQVINFKEAEERFKKSQPDAKAHV
ncbi:putative manganese superoxide dismutase precursor [Violaceomyces palustris]|uniref:Manganese superoxide dismutase n=1 Tax=Violaceomyces palustris TaxID=1673888 RepID=A0ACD0NVG4_9BASI|nr:putative manganese superoxide dismutase precursor [Violaceomyces palustris]